ncbi:MAG: hypothetical protein IKS21_03810 [Oscillospiraceae bacterium]|nr:hypothetical protein [Oscillospiraceae bacterium]
MRTRSVLYACFTRSFLTFGLNYTIELAWTQIIEAVYFQPSVMDNGLLSRSF